VLTERYGPEAQRKQIKQEEKTDSPYKSKELQLFSSVPQRLISGPVDIPGCGSKSEYSPARWSKKQLMQLASQPGRKKSKVAIIGSGPSGLTVAHDLAVLGHEVTIYEAGPKPGGMLRYGVPVYRIDQEDMDLEIQSILDLGVQIHYNTRIGEEITLADLRLENQAVFLGIGLMKGRMLNIEGSDLDGVITAVDLLLNYNMGYKVSLGKKVLVVGGGDVAMDAARTALRVGQLTSDQQAALEDTSARAGEEAETVSTALDVARTAIRLGVADVRMIALEDWHELPASEFELVDAMEEGIQIFPRIGPNRILGEEGKLKALEVIHVESVFDEQGRFNPKFTPGNEEKWDCDTLILAIGQQADLGVLGGAEDIRLSPRGLVEIDQATGQTSAPDVFAGGDAAYGPKLIIDAVKHGHLAALGIEQFIQEKPLIYETRAEWTALPNHVMFENWINLEHRKVPSLPLDRRTGISVVEVGYSEQEGAAQGSRCLECSVNTIFDGSKCILCNACVDVCPWDCLKITSLQQLEGDQKFNDVVEAYLGTSLTAYLDQHPNSIAAMIKDDQSCTRCALCAERCPTDAITMESFRFQEVLTLGEIDEQSD
jgi:formate dehydrogenase beta subunit